MRDLGLVALVAAALLALGAYLARRSGQRREAVQALEKSRERVQEKLAKLKEGGLAVTAEEERAIQTAEKMAGDAEATKDKIDTIDKVLDGIFSRYQKP